MGWDRKDVCSLRLHLSKHAVLGLFSRRLEGHMQSGEGNWKGICCCLESVAEQGGLLLKSQDSTTVLD